MFRHSINFVYRSAFTLVELLVVIAIIGLLSTVAVVSLGSARINLRNTKRIADLKQLTTAFSAQYIDAGAFPDSSASPAGWACISSVCTDGWSGQTANGVVDGAIFGSTKYISAKPTDPVKSVKTYGGYLYDSNWVGGAAPYDGYVFPAGAYLDVVLEPSSSAKCGPGRRWNSQSNYIECIILLNP